MANFHTDRLVIAASDEDMQKVLRRFAQNLAANAENTHFDLDSIDGVVSVRDLWRVVRPEIDAYYWLSFAGAPIERDVADAGAEEWGAHQENRAYLSSIAAAFGSLTPKTDDNVDVALSFAPTARPMSDTADVNIDSYGGNWVLTVSYSTAWEPNSNDLNLFFMGLPEGLYGVAFFDADEYDNFETFNTFCGLHHGRAGMRAAEIRTDDVVNASELKERKPWLAHVSRSEVSDLAELAEIEAVCGWSSGWEDDEDYDSGYDGSGHDGGDPLASWGYSINWYNPSGSDLDRIDKAILSVLGRFPWVVGSTGAAYEGRESNVERLVPGQPIQLVADWASPYFHPCAIQTRDAKGQRLGNLDGNGGGMELSDNARTALACILPHVRACADKVEPRMILDSRKRNSTVIVRLELTDEPLEHIIDEAHELLGKASNQRTVSSVVEEG